MKVQSDAQKRIVGTKQVLKALAAGELERVYLAMDAEPFLLNKLKAACSAHGIQIEQVPTMKELGQQCKIDVGAACAGERKE